MEEQQSDLKWVPFLRLLKIQNDVHIAEGSLYLCIYRYIISTFKTFKIYICGSYHFHSHHLL